MTNDAVDQLIARVTSPPLSPDANIQQDAQNFWGDLNTGVSIIANVAGIGAAIPSALSATVAGTLGFGLAVFAGLEIIATLTGGSPDASEALNLIYQRIQEIENLGQGNWSISNMQNIGNLSDTVYGILQNIADENPQVTADQKWGSDVNNQYTNYDSYAQKFVLALFLPPYDDSYWNRPYVESLVFNPDIIFPFVGGENVYVPSRAWYGNPPQPADTEITQAGLIFDPWYTLPAWLYAINSYLAIHMVLPDIDPSELSFADWLNDHRKDFVTGQHSTQSGHGGYNDDLLQRYTQAVQGLQITDLPSDVEFIEYLYLLTLIQQPWHIPFTHAGFNGNPYLLEQPYSDIPKKGYPWNGVFGVVDMYVAYFNNPIWDTESGVSYFVDSIGRGEYPDAAMSNLVYWVQAYVHPKDNVAGNLTPDVQNQIYPMVLARLKLLVMARWKAVYIMRGYHKAWSFLQNLRSLANQQPDEPLTFSFSDGTTVNATENWSARELFRVLNVTPETDFKYPETNPETNQVTYVDANVPYPGYSSLYDLATILVHIAGWDGAMGPPPYSVQDESRYTLPVPLSLRECLAGAAVTFDRVEVVSSLYQPDPFSPGYQPQTP